MYKRLPFLGVLFGGFPGKVRIIVFWDRNWGPLFGEMTIYGKKGATQGCIGFQVELGHPSSKWKGTPKMLSASMLLFQGQSFQALRASGLGV